MYSRFDKYYNHPAVRHYRQVVAAVVLGMFVGGLMMWSGLHLLSSHDMSTTNALKATPAATITELPAADPILLRIPAVAIEATFAGPLGLNDDQTVEVPDSYSEVGWYQYGPTPGERGPAVILGHVDSYRGPAVFWPLRQLKAGDEIIIDRADGTTATFIVTTLETHAQAGFPTEAVYSDLDYSGLRLITCSGVYNHGTLRYSHNLIVFAKLVATSSTAS